MAAKDVREPRYRSNHARVKSPISLQALQAPLLQGHSVLSSRLNRSHFSSAPSNILPGPTNPEVFRDRRLTTHRGRIHHTDKAKENLKRPRQNFRVQHRNNDRRLQSPSSTHYLHHLRRSTLSVTATSGLPGSGDGPFPPESAFS